MTTNDTLGLILLTLLAIGIVTGYVLFFGSVMKQDRMESGNWPQAKKPTKEQIRGVNRLLDHNDN